MRHIGLTALLLTACTGTIGSTGGGGDDNPPPPPTTVQITVQDGTAPQAGVRVLFQPSDGPQIEIATDATGIAKTEMPLGGNITVIRTYPQSLPPPQTPKPAEVYTYVGVKAGDSLVLGHETDDSGTPGAINVVVPDAAQGNVTVVTPCGTGTGQAPNVPITVTGCPSMLPVFAHDDGQDSFFVQMPYASNLDLSHQLLVGSLTATLSATNVQPNMQVSAELRILSGMFAMYSTGNQGVDGGAQNVDLPNLQGLDSLVIGTITTANGTQMVARRATYAVTPTVIDASAGIIPYITGTPMYGPGTITWQETGTGTADAVIATLDVVRNGAMGGTPAPGSEYIRAILAAHTGASLAIPVLTGADAIYNPSMVDQIQGTHGLIGAAGGYDVVRPHAFSVSNVVEGTPENGQITLSYAGNTAPTL